MKLVYSNMKDGTSKQVELDESAKAMLMNRKVGEILEGSTIGVPGVKLKITGGSDNSGFPMVKNLEGSRKFSTLKTIKSSDRKGEKKRQTVVGNTISVNTEQINAVIVEEGEEEKEAKDNEKK